MDIGRKKLLLDYLERDGTKEFSFYGWVLGLSILLLFINYGVYTKSNIGTFFDAAFAVLNFIFIFLISKKIFTLKNKLSELFNQEVKNEKKSIFGKIIGYLLILFIFLLGVFLIFYFSDKSAYVYTVYSLGLSFMIISIFLFYFSIAKKS
ncbi:hypothetical protein F971_00152 [Acinetobacter vivianii]|uniref:Uncharacterized protein n=1 Tax=Acinetobacter vivianii TaxID=1776742 RepID=N8V3S3_9GAMM|nr:hypothetical protein [Acinetobacter vivianii]ENU94255.1 hypothetical protein F971_00152 [Acinetobacter vivianii]